MDVCPGVQVACGADATTRRRELCEAATAKSTKRDIAAAAAKISRCCAVVKRLIVSEVRQQSELLLTFYPQLNKVKAR
jgi:hypothetical protein